jgi:3-phenylpropionate/trans-cinnamate dioxygenase ferredoxin reductase component
MNHHYDVVIVGAGHAGVNLAGSLMKGGFIGSVALLSDETSLPYKRPPLSKGYLLGTESAENLPLRSTDYWTQSPVDLLYDASVCRVDARRRVVWTEAGDKVSYGRLVWAAGGYARPLQLPGIALTGVHNLRNLGDADRLKAQVWSARRALVVGGGYIGLEIAAAFRGLGLEVAVVETGARVLQRVTSSVVSDYFQRVHRAEGIDLRLNTTVAEFCGTGNRLTSAVLSDGTQMGCDIAVIGVGMEPNVEVLREAGAACRSGIDVDEFGRTSLEAVSAAGDCTNQLHPYGRGERVRLESVQNAGDQAKVVASDLLGTPTASNDVPWFWSDQYTVKLKSAGIIATYDAAITRGDPDSDSFAVLYIADGRLIALDCINRPTDFAHGRALIKSNAHIRHDDFADPERSLQLAMR